MSYPSHLIKLIAALRQLPGVGAKTAERYAFHLIEQPIRRLEDLAHAVREVPNELSTCGTCGSLVGNDPCTFCDTSRRDAESLCVVASPKDVFAMEETRQYRGLYHVLGGHLSPLQGKGPETLTIDQLFIRLDALSIKEVIIALDSTVDGDATALYLKQELENRSLSVSRLAFGLPMGSPLDYVDGGTLARALSGRFSF